MLGISLPYTPSLRSSFKYGDLKTSLFEMSTSRNPAYTCSDHSDSLDIMHHDVSCKTVAKWKDN